MHAKDIPEGRLYDAFTFLMTRISPPEDYREEAAIWRNLLREKLGAGRHRILEPVTDKAD